MKKRIRVVGRRRWATLTRYLESVMETSKSERTRMTAALRLCDVLLAREQREQAELRAAERSASKEPGAVTQAESGATTQAEETDDDAVTAARAFIAKLGSRAANGEATHE